MILVTQKDKETKAGKTCPRGIQEKATKGDQDKPGNRNCIRKKEILPN